VPIWVEHAQLFVGPEGSGTLAMAIAYAQYILWQQNGENKELIKLVI
jgi:DNA polymerase-3 subunit delta'